MGLSNRGGGVQSWPADGGGSSAVYYQPIVLAESDPAVSVGRSGPANANAFARTLLVDTSDNDVEVTPDDTTPFMSGDSLTIVHKQVPTAIVGLGNLLTDPQQIDIPDWVIYGGVTDEGLTVGPGPSASFLQARKLHIPASSGSDANLVNNFGNVTVTGFWVGSVWMRGVLGGEEVYLQMYNVGGDGAVLRCTLTTEWQQFQVIRSYTAFVDNVYVEIGYDGSFDTQDPIDACDIEVAYGQLEPGITASNSSSLGINQVTFNAPVLYNGVAYPTFVLNNPGASLTFTWSIDEARWIVTSCYEPMAVVPGSGTITLPRRANQYIKGDSTLGAVTINYPLVPLVGDRVVFKDSSGNAAALNYVLSGNGKLFDAGTPITVTVAYTCVVVVYDGSRWGILT